MKTTRLVLLLSLVLLALLSVDRAAGDAPPAGSRTLYLPLVFKDWTPVTQTHFIIATDDLLVIELEVDGTAYASDDEPLTTGTLLTLPLEPGEHTVTVELGRWVGGVSNRPYAWSFSFTQERLQTVVITIRKPALADVLSGYGDELYWQNRLFDPSAPDGICFRQDGSFFIPAAGDCPQFGIIEEVGDVAFTREFNLVGEDGAFLFRAIYREETYQSFDLYPPGEPDGCSVVFEHSQNQSCPPVPAGCPVSSD